MNKQWMLALPLAMLVACGGGGGGSADGNGAATGSGSTAGGSGAGSSTSSSSSSGSSSSSSGGTAQATAVGTPLGNAVSALIDSAGGTLASADGSLSVEVPAGAFATPQTVSIQEISDEAHGATGHAFRITPEGLHSALPMTLRFHYTADDVAGTTPALLSVAWQDAQGRWRVYKQPQRDTATQTLSVQTTHFSDWSMIAGARLLPATASVKVGHSVALAIKYCEQVALGDDDADALLVSLLAKCESNPLVSLGASGWAVNGTPGGSPGSGVVVADADTSSGLATYTAPAKKPAQNPVAVSVNYTAPFDSTLQILVSNIEVLDDAVDSSPCGWLRNAPALAVDAGFDEFSFSGSSSIETIQLRQTGRVIGNIASQQQLPDYGYWAGYLAQGEAHVDDSRYTPGNGATLTEKGDGAPFEGPDEKGEHGSSVAVLIDFAHCTYTLHARVNVVASVHDSLDEGPATIAPDQVGAFSVYNVPISAEETQQQTAGGVREVQAQADDYSDWGAYVPGGLTSSAFFDPPQPSTPKVTVRWSIQRAD